MTAPTPSGRPDEITVLIADDEPLVQKALADCLGLEPLFKVVGFAPNAEEAIALAKQLQPHVAVVDFNMPGGGQLAARGILEHSPATRIVALSGSHDHTNALEMLRAGAASYVVKGAHPDEIIETILRSARGASILAPEVATGVIDELTAQLDRRELEGDGARRLLERIRRVIDDELFQTVFQPILDIATGKTVGFEALTRFHAEPAQTPERWFADAGSVGLRTELELATAQMAVARFREANPDTYLALNASPETLPSCGELFHDSDPTQAVIEITEHAAIDNYGALAPVLDALRQDGLRIAVDDAGAGFASLRHALHLSPDFIKLDVSLTRGIDTDPRRRALAAGLIGFANELGAEIIAEGIETKAELTALQELRVSYGQGYYLAKPAPLPAG